jgi:hypothetical protein
MSDHVLYEGGHFDASFLAKILNLCKEERFLQLQSTFKHINGTFY